MSIRKRPANLIDRFDSRDVGTFNQKPTLQNTPVSAEKMGAVPNLTVYQALEVISVLLKDYQSKHLRFPDSDPFHLWFPYAWVPIEVGDEIKNLVTNEIYRVVEILTSPQPNIKNYVRVQGQNAPKEWEMLRLDDKKSKVVNIIPAYPDTEIKPYTFTSAGHIQNQEEVTSWVDSITYTIVREEPGSRDRSPFSGTRELVPRYRETINNQDIYNQMIDTEIRFDFWTKSNDSSEKLREWFRDFSSKYMWLIRYNGVSYFYWTGSHTASGATRWQPDIVHRSANYFFRTEYSISENLFTIRTLDIKVLVPLNGQDSKDIININI